MCEPINNKENALMSDKLDPSSLFEREYDLMNGTSTLTFYQATVGEVGCVVWDAALVLCRYLELLYGRDKESNEYNDKSSLQGLQGKGVVDLGAGTGAVGVVAAALGAAAVVTDRPLLLPLMQYNVSQNTQVSKLCKALPLEWGDVKQADAVKQALSPARVDLVTVADCVYYNEAIGPLVESLCHLCSESTTVLCCYEERDLGGKAKMQEEFFQKISAYFSIKEIPTEEQDPHFSCPEIRLFSFHKKVPS